MPVRAVFDTNVYISIFVFPEKPLGALLDLAITGEIDLFVCPFIIEEFRRIVRSKFHFNPEEAQVFTDRILNSATLIHPTQRVSVIKTHEEDSRIIECALGAEADFLVTGNRRHLIPLKKFKGIRIITPSEFASFLQKYLQ